MDKLDQFLSELSDLSVKYGFSIGGCGCCGSPWICDENYKIVGECLNYDDRKYSVEGR